MVSKLIKDGQKQGLYVLNEAGTHLSLSKRGRFNAYMFPFMKNMLLAFVDTYMVVGLTIQNIMARNLNVDQNRLVNELHIVVQELYYRGIFKYMNSCLFEMLNSAIGRFSELGICTS